MSRTIQKIIMRVLPEDIAPGVTELQVELWLHGYETDGKRILAGRSAVPTDHFVRFFDIIFDEMKEEIRKHIPKPERTPLELEEKEQ